MASKVKTAKNSKLPKLPENVLSQLEKVGGHQYPPGLGCNYPYWWFPLLCQQISSLAAIQRVFFMYRLHLVHAKDA
jgi:hypothetical protein